MKTLQQILEQYKSETLDDRDLSRLAQFLTVEQIESLGMSFNNEDAKKAHTPKEFTRENVLAQLQKDVEFGFEKALGGRGISSSLMFAVVKMWCWILEEGLEDFDDYPMYGLPLFKAVAVKYGFDNPIGDDCGNENQYGEY